MIIKRNDTEYFREKDYLVKHKIRIKEIYEKFDNENNELAVPKIEYVDNTYLVMIDNKYLFRVEFNKNNYDIKFYEDIFFIFIKEDRAFRKANENEINDAIQIVQLQSRKDV